MKNPLLRFSLACVVIAFGTTVRAQGYTPVQYNFGKVFEVPDDSSQLGYTPTDLTIDCLAANGYGQWTSSYKTQNAFDSGRSGLFLLANSLRKPVFENATGIVSGRSFVDSSFTPHYPVDGSNRSLVKCVCNLKGRVRYVYPSADGGKFFVEGFDECPPNDSTQGLTGINLEFVSYPYNASYGTGHQLLGRDVIKTPGPVGYPSIGILDTLVDSLDEPDPRNRFDIAMDTANLYIVWESIDSFGTYYIHAISQSLSSGVLSAPYLVLKGRRPTIYDDVRRGNTTLLASFDVAYISGLLPADHITWCRCKATMVDTIALTKSCQNATGIGTFSYNSVSHVKMLDATWEHISSSDSTPRAIYAIVSVAGQNHLIMYKIHNGVPDAHAYYCDGPQLTNHAPGVNDGPFSVIDNPIRAFVNPYDGEADSNFDEYHCMYQLNRNYLGGSHSPLMLIHGAMVSGAHGPKVCLNFADTNSGPGTIISRPDSIHRFYADPAQNNDGGYSDNYNGAVNQMGIHLHWRNDTSHYYLRDRRMFDENIEENTLATDDVYLSDGTSHGGNYTPTIQPGKIMTLWTDSILPAGYFDQTNEQKDGVSLLFFPDSGVNHSNTKLVVGTGSDTASKLILIWNTNFYGDTSSQLVEVKRYSSIDEHGFAYVPLDGISVKLDGLGASMSSGSYSCPDSISAPAFLTLHGGSTLQFSGLLCDSGIISCKDDQTFNSIVPNNSFSDFFISGLCHIHNSIIQGIRTTIPTPIFDIDGYPNSHIFHGNDTFSNCLFKNGFITLQQFVFDTGGHVLPPLIFAGGKFDSTSINGEVSSSRLTLQNILFDAPVLPASYPAASAIYLYPNTGVEFFDSIGIIDCKFLRLPTGADAIYLSSFATDSSIPQNLVISDNQFDYSDGVHHPRAAVELDHSEGIIENNGIEGQFQYGIRITGGNPGFTTPVNTKSTICSNYIKGGDTAGIYTANTQGYSEHNFVNVMGAGHISGSHDNCKIIYSNYSACIHSGIVVSDSTAFPDLTGIHSNAIHPDSIDIAAFDTIDKNWGYAQIAIVKDGHIALGNDVEAWSWQHWCQNNILTSYSDIDLRCMCDTTSLDTVLFVPYILEDTGKSISKLGKINHNYFGDSSIGIILPENQPTGTGCDAMFNRGTPSSWITGVSSLTVANGFCYFADTNYTFPQGTDSAITDCEAALPLKVKPKGRVKTLSTPTDTSCREKFAIGSSLAQGGSNDYEKRFGDSVLVEFIETCYDTSIAYLAFGDLSGASFGSIYSDTTAVKLREWLKTVLWLGASYPYWYCACAQSIYNTYWTVDAGGNYNAALAVIRYLDSSGRCNESVDKSDFLAGRHRIWLDTVKQYHHGDTLDFPEDTTLPTIDDLGLQILRGLPASELQDTTISGISNLTASVNPFGDQTVVTFNSGKYAYVSFQVFDELGRIVQGDYKGTVLSPGSYSFTVDGTGLSSGTYYGRITTPDGETRTIKLVKK